MSRFLKFILVLIGIIITINFPPIEAFTSQKVTILEKEDKAMDYEKLKIKSFKYWDLYLHENQCYLGRTFVQLKDESGIEDFLDIKGEVREEFFQIGQSVKKALKNLFKPDKMNYAALSNKSPVIHMHIIPRYKDAREFGGITFKDTRWGQNYAPYDRSFVLDEAILFKIRDALRAQL
jgi:diadenosine tetraphosphate (Ap4A) HIT family hydrolase